MDAYEVELVDNKLTELLRVFCDIAESLADIQLSLARMEDMARENIDDA